MEKEYVLECECGAKYLYQGKKDDLNKFLDSQIWMCNLGRHDELGKKGDYLKIVEVRDKLSKKTEVEPKKKNEYTVSELQKEFGTTMEHIGFGIFKDPGGNIWDYRIGKDGIRLYSKTH